MKEHEKICVICGKSFTTKNNDEIICNDCWKEIIKKSKDGKGD